MIRLFAALEVPPDVGEDLFPRQRGLPGARWRPPESLHVTLRFYGEVQEAAAADLDAELALVRTAPFELALEGVGAFGEGHQLHAIWAGVADSEPLRVLAGRCERAARRAGVKVEARAYRPHVTLAYLDRHADPARIADWITANALLRSPPWQVSWFGLWSSWRTPHGSRYDLEREYPLV
ncbi:MAG TPA: RNA 2',3'-cyclic phosphodiesterase [Caulobacteraceae bacterium]|jgi:2'-5' RNA ligase|nr:RNA 2',3'-cyclic phosphodiesterase [Caulobacteraceae bacterium]